MRRLLAFLDRAWHAYRVFRWTVWALGVLSGVAGVVGGFLALWAGRVRNALLEDAPEYAADTSLLPFRLDVWWTRVTTGVGGVLAGVRVDWRWLAPLGVLLVLWLLTRIPVPRPDNPWDRDPQRFFSDADREWIRGLTQDRCEHRWLLGLLRCRRAGGQMDHHYPWSKGGATDRHNLVWLCARHNRRKSDHVPSLWGTWLLTRARLSYLPPRWRGYAHPDGLSTGPHGTPDDGVPDDAYDPFDPGLDMEPHDAGRGDG